MSILENFKRNHVLADPQKRLMVMGPFIGGLVLIAVLVFVAFGFTAARSGKQQVLSAATAAVDSLSQAQDSLSQAKITESNYLFEQAGQNFTELEATLNHISNVMGPLGNSQLESASHIVAAGKAIASAGSLLTQAVETWSSSASALPEISTFDTSRGGVKPGTAKSNININETFTKTQSLLAWAAEAAATAKNEMDQVDVSTLPESLRQSAADAKDKASKLHTGLVALRSFSDLLVDLTSGYSKSYLIIFENTAEARPGGGFIGTYGILRLKNGTVSSLLIESVYEIDGRLTKIVPPPQSAKPFFGERWYLRDANWWPDFKVNAETLTQFYEWEGGETVDGVIAVTPDMFASMIGVVGDIAMPAYDTTVTKENFYDVVQSKTSKEYDKQENKPKKFISDLAAEILKRIPNLKQGQKMALLSSFIQAAPQKNFMLYSREAKTQEKIEQLGLSGQLIDLSRIPSSDYLLISNANVGSGKTDHYIKREVYMETRITRDGQRRNRIVFSNKNNAPEGIEFPTNIDYVRFYVPEGSKLTSSSFDMATINELGRTAFVTTLTTPLGKESSVEFTYEIPGRNKQIYSLYIEKNPGQKIDNFNFGLVSSTGKRIESLLGQDAGSYQGKTYYNKTFSLLDGDSFFGLIFK